jgi:hypothetical protein
VLKVFRNRDTLIKEIAQTVSHSAGYLITVDGVNGSGKTHLSAELAQALGAEHVEVDRFLERHKGGYLEFVRYDELSRHLTEIGASGRTSIVDGILIEEIVRRLGCTPRLRVYVKRVWPDGYWPDSRNFRRDKTAEQVIKEEEEGAKQLARATGKPEHDDPVPVPVKEIIRYHFRFRPHETADYVYERVE